MSSVYDYLNYREFLRDWFAEKKATNPSFSHRLFARLAGFKTSNFLHLVMTGKRNLTRDSIAKVTRALKLRRREKEYFEHLVLFSQATAMREKNRHLSELTRLRKAVSYREINRDLHDYIANWVNPVVRELACMVDNPDDPETLAQRIAFHTTPGTVAGALRLLQRLGMLVRNPDGTFRQADPLLSTGPGTAAVAAAQYHQGAIARASEALERFPPSEREIVGLTIGVSRKTFEKVRRRMWELRQEVLSMADDPDAEKVYQLNIQLFPLTR